MKLKNEDRDLVNIKIRFYSSKYNESDPKFMELKWKINNVWIDLLNKEEF